MKLPPDHFIKNKDQLMRLAKKTRLKVAGHHNALLETGSIKDQPRFSGKDIRALERGPDSNIVEVDMPARFFFDPLWAEEVEGAPIPEDRTPGHKSFIRAMRKAQARGPMRRQFYVSLTPGAVVHLLERIEEYEQRYTWKLNAYERRQTKWIKDQIVPE